jgi:hypothetical protein
MRTSKIPRIIYTDKLWAYLDGIELTFGADTKHKQGGLFNVANKLRQGKAWQTRNQVSDAGTVVDQIYGDRYSGYRLKHPYIRLYGSINTWISSDGKAKSRMKIQLTVTELNRLSANEISKRAEKLAT